MDYDGVGSCDVTPAAQDLTYQLRPSLVPILLYSSRELELGGIKPQQLPTV